MSKQKSRFVCGACGHYEPKWSGRCSECGEWNSFREEDSNRGSADNLSEQSLPLSSIRADPEERTSSGIGEVDRVLGGGIMRGAAVLVGGEPGIGKSTLMLQIAAMGIREGRALYVSGEEGAEQLHSRAVRLGTVTDRIEVLCQSRVESILDTIRKLRPVLVVVDSIQTIVSEEAGPVPGTVNQIKYVSHELMDITRRNGISLFIVAHVTKEGTISGPKVVEHMVDTVLYFDQSDSDLRILRATKNRFGSSDEIGLFVMRDEGLREVVEPDALFLNHRTGDFPAGVVVAPVYEGSRILLVELQALVVPAKGSVSRVYSDRIDLGRVSRVAAVVEKHLGLRLSDHDIYVNVAGGIRINEVGIELPIALALYSARTAIGVESGVASAGELTLAGEVRPIRQMSARLKATRGLSIRKMIGPASVDSNDDVAWHRVDTIGEAIASVFGANGFRA